MDAPCNAEKEKYVKVRCAGKTGQYLSPTDLLFVENMYKTYPEWCEKTEPVIFERTKPFGAR